MSAVVVRKLRSFAYFFTGAKEGMDESIVEGEKEFKIGVVAVIDEAADVPMFSCIDKIERVSWDGVAAEIAVVSAKARLLA